MFGSSEKLVSGMMKAMESEDEAAFNSARKYALIILIAFTLSLIKIPGSVYQNKL